MPNMPLLNYAESLLSLFDHIWSPWSIVDNKSPCVKSLLLQDSKLHQRNNFLKKILCNAAAAVYPTNFNSGQDYRFDLLKSLEFNEAGINDVEECIQMQQTSSCTLLMKLAQPVINPLLSNSLNSIIQNMKTTPPHSVCMMKTSLSNSEVHSDLPPSTSVYFPLNITSVISKSKMTGHVNTERQQSSYEKVKPVIDIYVNLKPVVPSMAESLSMSASSCMVTSVPSACGKECSSVDVMNRERINRKSQKMNKLSKKRRRRQKKRNSSELHGKGINYQTTSSDVPRKSDQSTNAFCDAKNIGKTTNLQFVDSSHKVPESQGSSGMVISIKCDSPISKLPHCGTSSIAFIFEQIIDSGSDDDWDFDAGNNISTTNFDLEFPNLMSGIASLHIDSSTSIVDNVGTCISVIEVSEMSVELQAVNERWKRMMSNIDSSEKQPTKVSFAQEGSLTTIFPVEMYDRKSEWEIFARERFHFKRRIEEIETVIAPCLTPSHREKVLQMQSTASEL